MTIVFAGERHPGGEGGAGISAGSTEVYWHWRRLVLESEKQCCTVLCCALYCAVHCIDNAVKCSAALCALRCAALAVYLSAQHSCVL